MTGAARPAARSALLGAAFLMATSAIGPGFLTQTAVFTSQLGASFGFAILASIVLDIGAQLNVWRILAVAERRAPDVADRVAPGLGKALAAAVALGGLAFNIGNVAGCALGLQVLLGLAVVAGAALSAAIAIALFLVREAGRAMDRFAQALGFVMIALTLYVTFRARPPLADAALRSVWPSDVRLLPIVTLVGGTVGGYITFAGGHRLLDAGVSGVTSLPTVDRSAVTGILVTAAMRVLLFLAALGVVTAGVTLDPANPPASVFGAAAGEVGRRLFGIVMWAAAVTSVVGASYTSVSFLRSVSTTVARRERAAIVALIVASTLLFLVLGRPAKTLVVVGTINGFILPLALGAMLLAARRRDVLGSYRHPAWLIVFGWLVTLVMAAMSVYVAVTELSKLLG
ncbi:MAG TPA: NRAMP family divalent metal transporter [Gemmatimonadales bacterium]|nr:NRAMP family divalent metal transporter [Gemmatimonadales bacterium]